MNNENQAASDLSVSAGSAPIYPQPANSSDANWAGAQVGGMTLRQHYAGLAMQGILAANAGNDSPCYDWTSEEIAKQSVSLADEMVKFLSQNNLLE